MEEAKFKETRHSTRGGQKQHVLRDSIRLKSSFMPKPDNNLLASNVAKRGNMRQNRGKTPCHVLTRRTG